MNHYLIAFLIILAVYSGIWVGLKYAFNQRDENYADNMWYAEKEPSMSVSASVSPSASISTIG